MSSLRRPLSTQQSNSRPSLGRPSLPPQKSLSNPSRSSIGSGLSSGRNSIAATATNSGNENYNGNNGGGNKRMQSLGNQQFGRKSMGAPVVVTNNTSNNNNNNNNGNQPRHSTVGQNQNLNSNNQPQTNNTNGVKNDPRPLTDKSFMSSSIRTLLNYLIQHNYDSQISLKILTRPSSKDFNSIVTFLLRKIDPTFNTGIVKFEDEVGPVFKLLGYPFNISKTALYAVGSPHTWPGLLAAITWVIELLNYDREVSFNGGYCSKGSKNNNNDNSNDNGEGEEENGDELFFDYLGKAYTAFLSGDDDKYQQLEDGLIDSFEGTNTNITSRANKIASDNDEMVNAMEDMSKISASLVEVQNHEKGLYIDLDKFETLIKQLDEHKMQFVDKVTKRNEELDVNEGELRDVNRSVEELKVKVSKQDLSAEDVRRIQSERARIEENLEKAMANKDANSKTLYDAEQCLNGKIEEMEALALIYNAKATKLEFIPEMARNSNGDKYFIEVSVGKANASSDTDTTVGILSGVDIEGIVKPGVQAFKDHVTTAMSKAREDLLDLLDQEERHEENLGDAIKQCETISKSLRRWEETYSREKEQLDSTLLEITTETDASETRINTLRDPVQLESTISRTTAKLLQLNTLRQTKNEGMQERKQAVHDEILSALNVMADHKDYVQMQLKDLKEFGEEMVRGLSVANNGGGGGREGEGN